MPTNKQKRVSSKSQLKELLEECIKNLDNGHGILPYEFQYNEKLTGILNALLSKGEGSLEEFLMVAVGFLFWERLEKAAQSKPEDPKERYINGGGLLDIDDYVKTKDELLNYYSERLAVFKESTGYSQIKVPLTAVEWLKLAEERNICQLSTEFKKPIMLDYFGVDPGVDPKGLEPKKTLTIKELAQRLSLSENDAINYCLTSPEVGAHIKYSIKGVTVGIIEASHIRVQEIDTFIADGKAEKSYKHCYRGYLRLVKFGLEAYRERTLRYLHEGGEIKISSGKDYLFMVQPSMYQFITGSSPYLKSSEGMTLTLNDLFFMEEEVVASLERARKNAANRFNWEELYSEDNAKIIEGLLSSDRVSIAELSGLLFPRTHCFNSEPYSVHVQEATSPRNILNYFQKNAKKWQSQIDDWKKHPEPKPSMADPFDELLFARTDASKKITPSTLLKPKAAMRMLVFDGLLPQELKRLLRLRGEDIHFNVLPDYYESYDLKYFTAKQNNNLNNFIKEPLNYHDKVPPVLSYRTLKDRWKHRADNEIFIQCSENNLGVILLPFNRHIEEK